MSADALGMEPWEYYAKHPEDAQHFSRAMSGISGLATGPVLASYDFSAALKVVDVGGAHGALLRGILEKYPKATGVLFDLPHVVEGSKKEVERAGLAGRVETVGGDFFKEVPAGGDLYLLKHILHDWDDAKSVAILQTVRKAMKPTSKALVVEFPLPEDASPSPAHLMDLNMLVMLDGRERTPAQYGALFAKAGLRLSRFIPTPSPIGIAEAVPA
jgi:SAM-dependent methyltransferase